MSEEQSPQPETAPTVPPPQPFVFSPRQMTRQLWLDNLVRRAFGVAIVVACLFVLFSGGGGGSTSAVLIIAIVAAWILVSATSARISRDLPRISALIESDPGEAETLIGEGLRRRALLRWVRLLLYHRLAMLRHRQQRYAESAAISAAVLAYPLGPAKQAEAHLLLMLAESCLRLGDVHGAYAALVRLHGMKLSLTEALQRLALQTQYEVTIGADQSSLWRVHDKVRLSELMPAAQTGAVNAMLALAAQRSGDGPTAQWLTERAQLLCSPEQLRDMARAGLAPRGI